MLEWRFKELEQFPNRIICDDGTIYNKKGKKLQLKPSRNGYLRLRLYNKGKEFYKWVHRVIYEAFIGDCKGLEVHHIDKIRINNYYLNLLGATPEKHKYYHRKKVENYKPEEIKDCPF